MPQDNKQSQNAQPAAEHFTTTALSGTSLQNTQKVRGMPDTKEIGPVVSALFNEYKDARRDKEEMWLEAWAQYLGTPESLDSMRERVGNIVGDVNVDWRHRISNGKAYELVETIVGYLMGAFFPNSEWFDVIAKYDPGLSEVAKLTRKFMAQKLQMAQFRSYWEMYIRQLLITGFSVLAMPWERRTEMVNRRIAATTTIMGDDGSAQEHTSYPMQSSEELTYDNVAFDVIDSFDVFLDPNARDVNYANIVRVIRLTKADLMGRIASGEYPLLDPKVVAHAGPAYTEAEKMRLIGEYMGVRYDPKDLVEVIDFWGDVTIGEFTYHDVHIVAMGNEAALMEPNPYWGGRPFVIGTAIPVPSRVYGLGPLEPVLGLIHHVNSIMNQRADNLELAVDTMWGVINDGVTNPDDIFTAPGKVIEMGEPGSVFAIPRDTTFTVSYTEQQVIEQAIDRTVGAGVGITTAQGRKGERVTAQEIQAVLDAGGNRLSNIHGHIEDTQLQLLLNKMIMLQRQFVEYDSVVRLPGEEPKSVMYVQYGPRELMFDYDLTPVGAEYVANRERELQQAVDYINLVSQVPQFSEQVNWEAMLHMVTRKFGFKEDTDTFLKPKQESPQQPGGMMPGAGEEQVPQYPDVPAAQDPESVARQHAMAAGGLPAVHATNARAQAAGGADQLLAELMMQGQAPPQ